MLWKILSGIAALCLAGASYFSWETKKMLQQENAMAERSKRHVADIQKAFNDGTASKESSGQKLEEFTKQLEDLKEKVADATTEVAEKTKEAEVVNLNLTEVKKQVAELEDQIKKHGDLQKLLEEVKLLTDEKTTTEAAVANKQQQMALSDERVVSVQKQLQTLREAEASQTRGVLAQDFTARVSQSFPDFGFVILNKGNQAGVVANANLEVRRGGNAVAKLKVRDVEQGRSVADIVVGSMSPQDSVRSGDLVVASKQPAPTPTPASPPPASTNGTAPPLAPDAPLAPDMATDPFATSADAPATPAADATTPADPFAAPADAAPAATAPADPFAPPASAAPATPAAPADPFAPSM